MPSYVLYGTFRRMQLVAGFLTPAHRVSIGRVTVHPEVIAVRVTIEVQSHSVPGYLRKTPRGVRTWGINHGGEIRHRNYLSRSIFNTETIRTGYSWTKGRLWTVTSATERTQYMEGCRGSMPSSLIPTLNPLLLWGKDWCCNTHTHSM